MSGDDLAYPWGEHGTVLGGLTKRELFAAMAMQGFASCPSVEATAERCAAGAVAWADALLAELAKEPK